MAKDSVLDLIIRLGVPEEKIVAGVPAFATQFLLRDVNQNIPGSFVGQEPIQISKKKVNKVARFFSGSNIEESLKIPLCQSCVQP